MKQHTKDRCSNEYAQHLLPTCMEYKWFLEQAVKKLKITELEARNKYGQYSYNDWKNLLNLKL